MKQTSVDWLFEKLWEASKDKLTWHSILEQAKQMEKEQMIESYCQGCFDTNQDDSIFPRETSEQYYNENYKSE